MARPAGGIDNNGAGGRGWAEPATDQEVSLHGLDTQSVNLADS